MLVQSLTPDLESRLGPLSQLIGAWEGEKGHETSSPIEGSEDTKYRETITFEPIGPVPNGEKDLYGLRYSTYAWVYGEDNPFHEELGYWFWSPEDKQVIRCFTNHNGVTINAGGACDDTAEHIKIAASMDSGHYGIMSNPVLNNDSKTLSYRLDLDFIDENNFGYNEEIHMQFTGLDQEVIYRDCNQLTKVY